MPGRHFLSLHTVQREIIESWSWHSLLSNMIRRYLNIAVILYFGVNVILVLVVRYSLYFRKLLQVLLEILRCSLTGRNLQSCLPSERNGAEWEWTDQSSSRPRIIMRQKLLRTAKSWCWLWPRGCWKYLMVALKGWKNCIQPRKKLQIIFNVRSNVSWQKRKWWVLKFYKYYWICYALVTLPRIYCIQDFLKQFDVCN